MESCTITIKQIEEFKTNLRNVVKELKELKEKLNKENDNKMENLWELIAEKRGLKIGEEFKYSGNYSYIVNRITEEGLEFKKDTASSSAWEIEDQDTLANFIIGVGTIEKLPPKFADPIRCKEGNNYKTVSSKGEIVVAYFQETDADLYRKKAGNMFAVDAVIPQEQIDKIVKEMKE